jgi:subtilase family serine protease
MTVAWNKTYQLKEIGTYDFLFKVNPDATVKEYLYNNNSAKRKTISREALPDLVVWLMTTKVDIIARSRVWVGVKNIGQKTSSPTKLKFYIQTKGTKYLDIPPIAPGKFYTAERRPWFHSLKDVWVEMTIDPYHTLREDKERNNYAKKKLKVWSHTIFDK